MMLKRSIGGLIAALALMIGVEAFAQSPEETTFQVTADVNKDCTIAAAAGGLDFGTYDPLADVDIGMNLTISCTAGTTATVALDEGLHHSGTFRRMSASDGATPPTTYYLEYELYTTAGRNIVWNDTTNMVTYLGEGIASFDSLLVSGRLFSTQTGPVGGLSGYADTITVTVTY